MAAFAEADSTVALSTSASTLSQIFNVDPKLLEEKFRIQPRHRYDAQDKENLVFLTPTVLLDDLELREGGLKDRGAKEVLGRLAKDILTSKNHTLFQVPEVTYFHMGYGRRSKNKKRRMAITETDSQAWMTMFRRAALMPVKRKRTQVADDDDDDDEDEGQESPMDIACSLLVREGSELEGAELEGANTEDVIVLSSGRKVLVRHLLFFSILLIFHEKKLKETDKNERGIAENKVSDLLLFWLIPYLLNFTQRMVRCVDEHHKREKTSGVPTVQKSAMDIIKEALDSCRVEPEVQETILAKYKEYYGTQQLQRKYSLPAVETCNNEPIILVPLHHQVRKMPLRLEDIGTKWSVLGPVHLIDEFLSKFIENTEIQDDFLDSIKDQEEKEKYRVDYGIILPDEDTFTDFILNIEEKYPDHFRKMPQQGRDFVTPRLALIKSGNNEYPLSVCFSYFQGNDAKSVATLFRIIGSYRLNHFTLAVLNGASVDRADLKCRLLSLYPVASAGKFRPLGEDVEVNFRQGIGSFCKLEFPRIFPKWEQEAAEDPVVKECISQSKGALKSPTFGHNYPLKVAYTSHRRGWEKKIKKLKDCQVRAVNLEGSLLYMIARSGCKSNVGVVLAINDCLEPIDHLSHLNLQEAVMKTIGHFLRAVVVADLSIVYPVEGSTTDRKIETASDGDDDDDETDYGSNDDDDDDGSTQQYAATPPVLFKPGTPPDDELDELAGKIVGVWQKLGLRLKIPQHKLEEIAVKEKYDAEYKMLIHWKKVSTSSATYEVLYHALCHERVCCNDVAEMFCLQRLEKK